MPLLPGLRRLSQADLCEFQANLVCIVNSGLARATSKTLAQVEGEGKQDSGLISTRAVRVSRLCVWWALCLLLSWSPFSITF